MPFQKPASLIRPVGQPAIWISWVAPRRKQCDRKRPHCENPAANMADFRSRLKFDRLKEGNILSWAVHRALKIGQTVWAGQKIRAKTAGSSHRHGRRKIEPRLIFSRWGDFVKNISEPPIARVPARTLNPWGEKSVRRSDSAAIRIARVSEGTRRRQGNERNAACPNSVSSLTCLISRSKCPANIKF